MTIFSLMKNSSDFTIFLWHIFINTLPCPLHVNKYSHIACKGYKNEYKQCTLCATMVCTLTLLNVTFYTTSGIFVLFLLLIICFI